MSTVMQGDQYSISIIGSGFDISDVSSIEFVIGPLTKSYPSTVTYDSATKIFAFPITQAETLGMFGTQKAQARVKFTNGNVVGATMGTIDIRDSLSHEVL